MKIEIEGLKVKIDKETSYESTYSHTFIGYMLVYPHSRLFVSILT